MLMLLSACGQGINVKHVGSKEFQALLKKSKGTLLDVRTEKEFERGHIANAGLLNLYSPNFKQKLLLLPKNQPIYLYCYSGSRSKKAAEYLVRNGYTQVYNLMRGIMEWNRLGLPTVAKRHTNSVAVDMFKPADFDKLIKTEKLVFIDYYAPWCSPCKKMMPMIESLKKEYKGKIRIVKVNTDASKELVVKQNVTGVPSLQLYKNGKRVFNYSGYITKEKLVSVFESNLNGKSN